MILTKWRRSVRKAIDDQDDQTLDELLQDDHLQELRPGRQTELVTRAIENGLHEQTVSMIERSDDHNLTLDSLTKLTAGRDVDAGRCASFLKSGRLREVAKPPADQTFLRNLHLQTARTAPDAYYDAHRDLMRDVLDEEAYEDVVAEHDWSERIKRYLKAGGDDPQRTTEFRRLLRRKNPGLPDNALERALNRQSMEIARVLFASDQDLSFPDDVTENLPYMKARRRHDILKMLLHHTNHRPPEDVLVTEAREGYPEVVAELFDSAFGRSNYDEALKAAFGPSNKGRYDQKRKLIRNLLERGAENGWLNDKSREVAAVGLFNNHPDNIERLRDLGLWNLVVQHDITINHLNIDHSDCAHKPDVKGTNTADNVLRGAMGAVDDPEVLDFLYKNDYIDEEWINGSTCYDEREFATEGVKLFRALFDAGAFHSLRYLRNRDMVPDNAYPLLNSALMDIKYIDDPEKRREVVGGKFAYAANLYEQYDMDLVDRIAVGVDDTKQRGPAAVLRMYIWRALELDEQDPFYDSELSERLFNRISETFDIRSADCLAKAYRAFDEYVTNNGFPVGAHAVLNQLSERDLYPPQDVLNDLQSERLYRGITNRLPERKKRAAELTDD